MTLLTQAGDIWVIRPTKDDLLVGAKYATVSMPATFNRMMMTTSSRGQQTRALNIAKGIVGQEMLRRELIKRGIQVEVQRKSHRDEDLFDFRVMMDRQLELLDLKTLNHFNNYPNDQRFPLSLELIIQNIAYPGPDWRHFFPMLVPHTQIAQPKEVYCFAIASSIDFRGDISTQRVGYDLTAFPYGKWTGFLSSPRLRDARERAKQGFYVRVTYVPTSLFGNKPVVFKLVGEWLNELKLVEVELVPGEPMDQIGPFSCIDSFKLDYRSYDEIGGGVEVYITRNDFGASLRNSRMENINVPPGEPITFGRGDFCNLLLPSDYVVYCLGWIRKKEFLSACRKYPAWVWPAGGIDRFANQPWSQITERDMVTIRRASFEDCIARHPTKFNAGWMKTTGQGGGAGCYVYPPIGGAHGGVRETNLYVLPQDLHVMDELGA